MGRRVKIGKVRKPAWIHFTKMVFEDEAVKGICG
jgi:hypothetical protein